jgi:hypothetical protein
MVESPKSWIRTTDATQAAGAGDPPPQATTESNAATEAAILNRVFMAAIVRCRTDFQPPSFAVNPEIHMPKLAAFLLAIAYRLDPSLRPPPVQPNGGGGPGPINPGKIQ